MNECGHENAALRIEELTEIDICADCEIEIVGLTDNTDEDD